ncbi:LETM1-related biofilm-associated protein [Flavobacterium sedimenticola]|uniref:LETM1-related biofilm-associated protein n=1 Tax=Flavobacterium sedimenticola TaxID=3043286 RepID=A0ABT6XSR5_9FLAO|nr:LETM1-related biofilm-associated protein [Flavobacterium sedimenticola]MDI9258144.1 LETM1-related biofilm-associated protein [Flavobacterium sedimenticola]
MINPSVPGWIDKFFTEFSQSEHSFPQNETDFYIRTRTTGFIFGHIVGFDAAISIETEDRFPQEISKIGMLNTLFQVYRLIRKTNQSEDFIQEAVAFYNTMIPKGFNPLKKVLESHSPSSKLEKIIHDRVQTNEDLFSKNFSHVITNALLFIDVLAFKKHLEKGEIPEKYSNKIEDIVISIISLSLKSKTGISPHDDLLLKLFESSVRYNKFSSKKLTTIEDLDLSYLSDNLEKYYVIDLAGISLWSDEKVENEERYFLFKLGETLQISDAVVLESIHFINEFIVQYKSEIPYFNFSNPVKHFYEQTTESVAILINRNKSRLLKEITESKELMQLLAKSTVKDLNKEEKKKVKRQMLDICKTIPSLTIFLLPGGGLLLPILIKFIPKMLPSAFNENIDD